MRTRLLVVLCFVELHAISTLSIRSTDGLPHSYNVYSSEYLCECLTSLYGLLLLSLHDALVDAIVHAVQFVHHARFIINFLDTTLCLSMCSNSPFGPPCALLQPKIFTLLNVKHQVDQISEHTRIQSPKPSCIDARSGSTDGKSLGRITHQSIIVFETPDFEGSYPHM
jgi:hypothetical protein